MLALMHLNAHEGKISWRAWKSFPWEATDGLYERGSAGTDRVMASSGCALWAAS